MLYGWRLTRACITRTSLPSGLSAHRPHVLYTTQARRELCWWHLRPADHAPTLMASICGPDSLPSCDGCRRTSKHCRPGSGLQHTSLGELCAHSLWSMGLGGLGSSSPPINCNLFSAFCFAMQLINQSPQPAAEVGGHAVRRHARNDVALINKVFRRLSSRSSFVSPPATTSTQAQATVLRQTLLTAHTLRHSKRRHFETSPI